MGCRLSTTLQGLSYIVFVHGLQGHPFKTWASTASPRPARSDDTNITERESKRRKLVGLVVGLGRDSSRKGGTTAPIASSTTTTNSIHGTNGRNPVAETVGGAWFWPRDSVPQHCPDARVLTWGYDTHVTRFFGGASCKGTLLSHGKDLLFSLARSCQPARPLIFVAHSLGGIVVKEMLSASEQSDDDALRLIVSSTAAVVFLGTPHRGSLDLARLGNMARAVVGAFGFDTTSAALDALGLKTSDLERCQESFSRLWRKYGFRVKTFQESLGLSGANIGPLNDQVVPGFSSLLGDPREHAETLHASHRGMCRYPGPDDPNQARVVGEIARLCHDVRARIPPGMDGNAFFRSKSWLLRARASQDRPHVVPQKELMGTRKALHFKGIDQSLRVRSQAAPGTCEWLFQDATFLDWHHRRNVEVHKGLLWLVGNPGSGKTTLIHEAYSRLSQRQQRHGDGNHVVAFFSNAGGPALSGREIGLYHSLLYQLLPFRCDDIYQCANEIVGTDRRGRVLTSMKSWNSIDTIPLVLKSLLTMPTSPPTVIFIDALDECSSKFPATNCKSAGKSAGMFFRELTVAAYEAGVQLNICISSRYYDAPTTLNSLQIRMEQHNSQDIATYVDLRLSVFPQPASYFESLKRQVLKMSQGIFLWVVLAVDLLVRDLEAGKNIRYLENHLCSLPDGLNDLFRDILRNCQEDRDPRLRFFQWAMLAGNGLQLREWRDILPFLDRPSPRSLEDSRLSAYYADTDEQLAKLIRHLSLGLVHVVEKTPASGGGPGSAAGSTAPDAGSLDSAQGDTRIVGPIHDSVRKFFLERGGFSTLAGESEMPITNQDGNAAIMHTCLDFIEIADLDAIVSARQKAFATCARPLPAPPSTPSTPFAPGTERPGTERPGMERPGTPASEAGSVRSFHSAGSSRHSMHSNSAPASRRKTSPTRTANHGKPLLCEGMISLFQEEDEVMRQRRLADYFQADGVGGPASVARVAAVPPSTLSAGTSAAAGAMGTATAIQWEYPDCTPYILAAFLRHAQRVGMDRDGKSDSVFARLREERLWRRWLALAEEPDQDETLEHWARRRRITRWWMLARGDSARVPLWVAEVEEGTVPRCSP